MRRYAGLLCAAAAVAGILGGGRQAIAAEAAWPAFRYDRTHSGRTDAVGPAVGSSSWSFEIGAPCSSPIAAGGRVYAVGAGVLYCWETAGTLIWSTSINSIGTSTPCLGTDGTMYVGSTDGYLYAINPNGSVKWRKSLSGAIDASPTVGADGSIYVGTRAGKMCAIRPDSGLRFTFTAGGPIASSAAVAPDGTIYFGCDDGKVYALKSDGTKKWAFAPTPLAAFKGSPSVGDDGTVYVGSMGAAFYAIWPDGRQRWRFLTGGAVYSSPAIATDGSICFGARDGNLYCLTKTGALKWKAAAGKAIDSSSAIDAGGDIYFGSNDGRIYAVNSDGSPAWSCDAGAEVASSPAVGDMQTLFVTTSDGRLRSFGMDTTPPDTPSVTDDGVYSSSRNTLACSWYSSDAESGVVSYEYGIGTAPGVQDVVPFTSCGLDTNVVRDGLGLVNGGVYYFSVRATNGCGLVSEVGVSDGIKVDFTPPDVPYVVDDGLFTNISGTLHFAFASGDLESGIARYEYCIGTAADNSCMRGWTDAGLNKDHIASDLTLVHGQTYLITVRAYNGAALTSVGKSNGITVDLTPPDVTVSASAASNEILATAGATDPESGVQAAEWALLTSPNVSAETQWKRVEVGKGFSIGGPFDWKLSYYVAVRALNRAGSWSAAKISAPIKRDLTPPTLPVVTDDGKYWGDSSRLHAAWSSQDPDSGIKRYSYCVGSSAGAADVVGWTDTTGDFADIGGLTLINGATYYISVRAVNGAGLSSGVGVSDGITIDTTPPAVLSVVDDGDYTSSTDTLHAVWTGMDTQSGVADFLFCVGTAPGLDDVAPWRSVGTATQGVATGLTLQPDTIYYFTVKAKNGAGLLSAAVSSDGILYGFGASSWPRFRHDLSGSGCTGVNGPSTPQLKWRLQTNGYVESSAAVSSDGKLYLGCSDGKLYAISSSGSVKWTYQTGSCIDSSPAVGPTGCVYFGSYDGYMYCLDPWGALKWRYATGAMIWSSPAVTDDGSVYFGCQDGSIYALNGDGTLKWRYVTGGAVWSSPSIGPDGRVYVGSGDRHIYCLNANGVLYWSYPTGSAVDGSPALDKSGVVYVGSGDGFVYAINPNGSRKWRQYVGRVADSSPAVTEDGRIYIGTGLVGSGGALHAFDRDGNQLWKLEMPGAVRSSPAVGLNGTIYVGCADSRLLAVTPAGGVLWQYKADQSILASPAITMDGSLVVGTDSGGIYCLKSGSVSDATPPSVPVVRVDRQVVTADAVVKASWSASDAESGVVGYSYAVGTQPGANDVAGWTDMGIESSVEIKGITWVPGRSYYISVVARNGAGLSSGIGTSAQVTAVDAARVESIGYAKQRPDGSKVLLEAVSVTAVYGDCVFVEDMTRSAGIRCVVSNASVSTGSVVSVSGEMSTRHGEKVIVSPVFQPVGVAAVVRPLGMRCGMDSVIGVDRNGLLVRVAGRVTRVGPDYIVITDGSFAASPRGVAGVEIRMTPPIDLRVGSYVGVTGVVCREVVMTRLTTIIRAAADPQFVVFK